MNVRELAEEIRQLSVEERKALISMIIDTLAPVQERSLLELEGLGAELWQDVDAQELENTGRL